jgi:PKD repeat protein
MAITRPASLPGTAVNGGHSTRACSFSAGVRSIAIDTAQEVAYLAGIINSAPQVGGGSLSVKSLIAWDGLQWSNPGNLGLGALTGNPNLYALALDEEGVLYVGGRFLSVDTLHTFRVARRHPSGVWGALGGGVHPLDSSSISGSPVVYALSVGEESLFLGGTFYAVGDKQASNIARYELDPILACNGPIADFSFQGTGLFGFQFQNLSQTFGNASYLWDFGDGNGSTQANPQHTYAFADSFLVSLIVSDSCGLDTLSQWVEIICNGPQADFTFSQSGIFQVQFQNQSQNTGNASYIWDFGDGNSSTLEDPQHSYAFADSFWVSLIVSDSCGLDTLAQWVEIICNGPQADFGWTAGSNFQVQFQDSSQGTGIFSWVWDFGDGNGSSQMEPQHTYAGPGNYQVCLIVGDSCGLDTLCQSVSVICEPTELPLADFSFQMDSFSLVVGFTNLSSNADQYSWDFGDGSGDTASNPVHLYPEAGTYDVCLIVSGICGIDTLCQSLEVICQKPTASFSFLPGDSLEVQFQADTSGSNVDEWVWDFGNGGTSLDLNPVYQYPDADSFWVSLIVRNTCGADTFRQWIDLTSVSLSPLLGVQLDLYPNPVQEQLFVRGEGLPGSSCFLILYDGTGRRLEEVELALTGGRLARRLDFSPLPGGVYVLELRGQNWRFSRRLVH